MRIIPLDGYCTAVPDSKLKSLAEEQSAAMGMNGFVVVDSKIGRNDALSGKCRVRKFVIREVAENAPEYVKQYVGKRMYCVCMENESENNVIVDIDSGEKVWFLPLSNILGYDCTDNSSGYKK